jgi:hypothetical protein
MNSLMLKLGGSLSLAGIDVGLNFAYGVPGSKSQESDFSIELSCETKKEGGFSLEDLAGKKGQLIFIDNLLSYNSNIKNAVLIYYYKKKSYEIKINNIPIISKIEEKSIDETGNDLIAADAKKDIFDLPALKIPIKKAIGPLDINNLGLKLDIRNSMVWIPLDAAISLSCLKFGLNGFSLGIPFGKDKEIECKLDGLSLAFIRDPIEISGGFLKAGNSFDGEALIKIKNFSLSALGSYSAAENPSLFIFALVSYPIGGPPCFYVTGLAAGFGYNRTLKIPEVDHLTEFPLVSYAISDNKAKPTLSEISGQLQNYIPPSAGDFWLAAGVKFTSFNMIYSFALLTINFGTKLEVALLGRSVLDVPSKGQSSSGFLKAAHAELLIKVKFDPEKGVVAATGKLAPNSYVLSKDCSLTGGFAFYIWFNGPNRGDFVLSLGGYHPAFKRPDHYPIVERLALNWPISPSLSIKGSGYFALTPSCIMAGGALEAVYQEGNLKAWFTAHADFLMEWKPFHYDINLGVMIGASYRVDNIFVHKTYTFELGADAHLWGPEFSGEVTIKWYFLSYTIKFGNGSSQPAKLGWEDFKNSFLPASLCNLTIARGLLKEEKDESSTKGISWIVDPSDFSISIHSAIPCTSIKFDEEEKIVENDKTLFNNENNFRLNDIHIKPMDNPLKQSCINIKIQDNEKIKAKDLNKKFALNLIKDNLPKALWSSQDSQNVPSAEMLKCVPVGLQLDLKRSQDIPALNEITFENIVKPSINWSKIPTINLDKRVRFDQMQRTFSMEDTVERRSKILNNLKDYFKNIETNINLKELLREPQAGLAMMPVSSDLGVLMAS